MCVLHVHDGLFLKELAKTKMNINFMKCSFRLTFVVLFHLFPQDDPDKIFEC